MKFKYFIIIVLSFFCSKSFTQENTFCLSQYSPDEFPTVAELVPSGDNILWYDNLDDAELGEEPLALDEEIYPGPFSTGTTYYYIDTNNPGSTVVSANVYLNDGNPPDGFNDEQSFLPNSDPKIIDLQPSGLQWFSVPSGGTELSSSTLLQNDTVYYGQVDDRGNKCRFEVYVEINTPQPIGETTQIVCENSTLADIMSSITPSLEGDYTIEWYDSYVNGNQLGLETVLQNNTVYYAAQIDEATGIGSENNLLGVLVIVQSVNPPALVFNTQPFYNNPLDPPTVSNLIAVGINVLWYDSPSGGNPLDPNDLLFTENDWNSVNNGEPVTKCFYASQLIGNCESDQRIQMCAQLLTSTGPESLVCERFRPQINKRYIISAWAKEQKVNPVNPNTITFTGSEYEDLFLDLLKHLYNVSKSFDKNVHDIPNFPQTSPAIGALEALSNVGFTNPIEVTPGFSEYKPFSEVEDLNFDALLPFVKGVDLVAERHLKVYDFTPLYDDYGHTIGFEFYLNASRDQVNQETGEQGHVFRFVTPVVDNESYFYPMLDQLSYQDIIFENADVTPSQLTITSEFSQQTLAPEQNTYPALHINNPSGLKHEYTFYDFDDVSFSQHIDYDNAYLTLDFINVDEDVISSLDFKPQGNIIDGWQRIIADFVIPANAAQMNLTLKNGADNYLYVDDIRMIPYSSNMKTFVYHPENQRLVSELDENNYATFYEYDLEGGLIRVKKETEKGVYTIQETRSSTKKQQ